MIEMPVHSRPGLVELLPALPSAWAASGRVTGVGARGGFTVDFSWSAGTVTTLTLHSVRGAATTVQAGAWSQVVTVPAGGSVTLTPGNVFQLVNRRSGKVIDVPGSSTSAGSALIQYTNHASDNQRWRITQVSTGGFELTNIHSALDMDVAGGSTADGASIIQWTPTFSTNQQWTLAAAGGGYVKVVSVRSGKVLGVAGDSTSDLAGIQQQTETGSIGQHWKVLPAWRLFPPPAVTVSRIPPPRAAVPPRSAFRPRPARSDADARPPPPEPGAPEAAVPGRHPCGCALAWW